MLFTASALALGLFFVSGSAASVPCTGNNGVAVPDACCVWLDVLDDIQQNLFDGGECNEDAHEALRLTFHDAIGYSPKLVRAGKFGCVAFILDPSHGSIMQWSDIELQDPANDGMDEIIEAERQIALRYNVSFGDFIQFAGAVGVGNCKGGPQLLFFSGRKNDSKPAPAGLIPQATDSVDTIINRVGDIGFSALQLVWMLISHTVGTQNTVDPTIAGSPLDSTPYDFDAQFFVETLLNGTINPGGQDQVPTGGVLSPYPGEFRLASDFAVARDPRTACEFQHMLLDRQNMLQKYKVVMNTLALLGQGSNVAFMTNCTNIIPVPPAVNFQPFLPAGLSMGDVLPACTATPFPSLTAAPVSGPMTSIPLV
ncbi:manganese peroxidase [Epithele typhae]|uniref:manganese peroxidase n=1 Tax=Epithele typhae TaxID=378194 RepID=UPI002007B4E9|nr:manganese peroxidase [Epithele typhae]KAH9935221.1 manganese peroxidase [Epithele typhae]